MSTYFDKKKLLEENEDIYISAYDKSLDANVLSQIIDAKKSYSKAQKNNDTAAMNAANQKANALRMANGSYDGGADGSEYNRFFPDIETRSVKSYSSPYEKEQKRLIKKLNEAEEFSYNPQNDPVFQSYRKLYSRLGDEAYDRALSKNALRTGGMINSSAQSSAMQAKNRYNSQLTDIIPKLYELAYSKHNDEFERMLKSLDAITEIDETEYNRYRDKVRDFEADRDYYYQKQKDISDALADRYEFDSNLEFDIAQADAKMQYNRERDTADDVYRNKKLEYDYENDKFTRALNLAKAIYGKAPISSSIVKSFMDLIG